MRDVTPSSDGLRIDKNVTYDMSLVHKTYVGQLLNSIIFDLNIFYKRIGYTFSYLYRRSLQLTICG